MYVYVSLQVTHVRLCKSSSYTCMFMYIFKLHMYVYVSLQVTPVISHVLQNHLFDTIYLLTKSTSSNVHLITCLLYRITARFQKSVNLILEQNQRRRYCRVQLPRATYLPASKHFQPLFPNAFSNR